MKIERKEIFWLVISFLVLLFYLLKYSNQSTIVSSILILIIPGLILLRNENNFNKILFAPVISLVILIALTLFFNILLKIEIDNFFIDKIFLSSLVIAYILSRSQNRTISEKINKRIFLFLFLLILFSIVIRLPVFLKIGTLIGTDITKFATISPSPPTPKFIQL